MRVLVTGAAGGIGSRVAADLEARGHTVRRFDVRDPGGAGAVQGDLRRFGDVSAAVEGMEAICHLGAIPGNRGNPFDLFESNVRGTFHVFEAAAQHGVKRIVFASSICALIGWSDTRTWAPQQLPLDESHPCQSDEMYGMGKEIGERLGRGYAKRYDMHVICLRLGGVALDDRPSGPGALLTCGVTCQDVVQAFRLGLETEIPYGVYNVSSRWRYTLEGDREEPEVLARALREAGIQCIDNRHGFLEGRSTFSIANAERDLGYDPEY